MKNILKILLFVFFFINVGSAQKYSVTLKENEFTRSKLTSILKDYMNSDVPTGLKNVTLSVTPMFGKINTKKKVFGYEDWNTLKEKHNEGVFIARWMFSHALQYFLFIYNDHIVIVPIFSYCELTTELLEYSKVYQLEEKKYKQMAKYIYYEMYLYEKYDEY